MHLSCKWLYSKPVKLRITRVIGGSFSCTKDTDFSTLPSARFGNKFFSNSNKRVSIGAVAECTLGTGIYKNPQVNNRVCYCSDQLFIFGCPCKCILT